MGGIASGLQPLRFTDSPQHYVAASGSNAPTPSPRRKTWNNEDAYSPEMSRIERVPTMYMGNPPSYSMVPSDYYRSEPTYYADYQYVV